MRRLYLVLSVAAILAVIALMYFDAGIPFFGREARILRFLGLDARVSSRELKRVEMRPGQDQSAAPLGPVPIPRNASADNATDESQVHNTFDPVPKARNEDVRWLRAGDEALSRQVAEYSETVRRLRLLVASLERETVRQRAELAAANATKTAVIAEADGGGGKRLPANDLVSVPPNPRDPVIIRGRDIAIRQSEFEAALNALPRGDYAYASGAGRREFAEQYLLSKILARDGVKSGVGDSPDLSLQVDIARQNVYAGAVLKRLERGIDVTEAELRREYQASRQDYDRVEVAHILIAFSHSSGIFGEADRSERSARQKAEAIRKKLLSGSDFAQLAMRESDDKGSGSAGGQLGWFVRGQLVPEFEAVSFSMKVNEISPVVKTRFGFHVIKLKGRANTSFEEAKISVEKTIREEKLQRLIAGVERMQNASFNQAYFGFESQLPAAAKR